jgi:hypothetical protein
MAGLVLDFIHAWSGQSGWGLVPHAALAAARSSAALPAAGLALAAALEEAAGLALAAALEEAATLALAAAPDALGAGAAETVEPADAAVAALEVVVADEDPPEVTCCPSCFEQAEAESATRPRAASKRDARASMAVSLHKRTARLARWNEPSWS